ncbi:Crp/Fnr family transcriptional regulator [Selenomonas ruminantium]|jgi:CRP-like cAMP-binding protein|uniref:cAMP-binding domain of CRP or a regulatory subunit of cAMP-dependent protein kinases n=1 Tax=Selenomonas ruminantium TaxID=971 RepID=A0A1K1NN46_SELRU|nr:Crp/Fnr family transcriptional regulator [Selenomonas ruminantium]SDZ89346.1 cAMP-binding domain of CRP or a regulatory subunit of cAMP-dependent protein kinases [Selenomonas ruminantium]SFW36693.1 cAMP-binding domain of CRP or a regulatory subunit of cAMP-dependent protein kinases [Selenomonas ruminantium]
MSGDREQLIPVLKKSSLAAGMSDEEVAELLASAQVHLREYPKGQIVFHEGDMPKSLYILLAGEVHILKDTFSGRRIFLSEINEPGDMFGEVYEVLKQPYDMYVETVTPVRLLEISSDLFTLEAGGKLSRSALKIQRNLMRIFARKAYFMHNKIKVLASGSLREKIIRFLFIELQGKRELELTGSREFMAAYLAVTRPSLSRELSAMQREGIIALDGKCVKVLDMERFEEYL